jgi:hypothetical protein
MKLVCYEEFFEQYEVPAEVRIAVGTKTAEIMSRVEMSHNTNIPF